MKIPAMLSRLWQMADNGSADVTALESIGLILERPPSNGGYPDTPVNSVAFAYTGGDGVHYSWLVLPDRPVDLSPIVMTVPMGDTPNVIVGESFHDFLCLGSRSGYFSLEQISYQPEEAINALASQDFDPEIGDTERDFLQRLAKEFNLAPWSAPNQRLTVLREKYLPLLDIV
ncbi:MAG: hypothetical protein LBV44_05290 [Methylobacillus sp.]|nr:hypothetical protein [Methylobacillus sp.]